LKRRRRARSWWRGCAGRNLPVDRATSPHRAGELPSTSRPAARVVHLGTDPPASTLASTHPSCCGPGAAGEWRPLLLTVARLEPHKGVDTVLRALPPSSSASPTCATRVGGAGQRARPAPRSSQPKWGVGERVRFLGEVSERDLPRCTVWRRVRRRLARTERNRGRGSASRSSRRRRADCRGVAETRRGSRRGARRRNRDSGAPDGRSRSDAICRLLGGRRAGPADGGRGTPGGRGPTTTGIAWCAICGRSKPRCWRGSLGTTTLLAFNFPPLGGASPVGWASWRCAIRPTRCSLDRPTRGSETSDAALPQPIDHTPIHATALRNRSRARALDRARERARTTHATAVWLCGQSSSPRVSGAVAARPLRPAVRGDRARHESCCCATAKIGSPVSSVARRLGRCSCAAVVWPNSRGRRSRSLGSGRPWTSRASPSRAPSPTEVLHRRNSGPDRPAPVLGSCYAPRPARYLVPHRPRARYA